MKINTKKDRRQRIALRQRKRISGTAERPRLRVFRSVSHIYAQVIDDMSGTTLAAVATTEPALKPQLSGPARPGNKAGAQVLGKTIAERLLAKGIKRVVFDRGGFLYHGRIRAVADAAREAGLEF
jgi:large subunit ribosomal protein L18